MRGNPGACAFCGRCRSVVAISAAKKFPNERRVFLPCALKGCERVGSPYRYRRLR
jgi:hypothetical protein